MRGLSTKRSGSAKFRQGGLASVEFAISTVVILLLMLASAEVSRAYYSYNTLTKAVRNGSRHLSNIALNSASVLDLSSSKISQVRNLVISGNPEANGLSLLAGLSAENVSISNESLTGAISQYVRVSAAYTYRPMLGKVSGFGFGEDYDMTFTMRADSTMRVMK